MKISCTQEKLAQALSTVSKVVGVRTTLPILSNILLKTEKGQLKLSATDLEIGLSVWIGAKVEEEGALTIPGRLFSDFVAAALGKTIDLKVDGMKLKVVAGGVEATLSGMDASEFPVIPEVSSGTTVKFPAQIFSSALSKTVSAAALDESRPVLSGILLWATPEGIKIVATDSYRLSEVTIPSKEKAQVKAVIPLRAAQELLRLSEQEGGEIALTFGENQVSFKSENTSMIARLIEGEFPNYQEVVPKSFTSEISVETKEIARALKVASLFAREAAGSLTLEVNPSKKNLTILAASPQVGENKTTLPIEGKGENLSVSFNARFLSDAVAQVTSKTCEIGFAGPLAPALVREDQNPLFFHLVMPLRKEG
jgi:DNA polymerase-3 subunit beta